MTKANERLEFRADHDPAGKLVRKGLSPDDTPGIGDILVAMRKIAAGNLVPTTARIIDQLLLEGYAPEALIKTHIARVVSAEGLMEKLWEGRVLEAQIESIRETGKQIKWNDALKPQYSGFELANALAGSIATAISNGKVEINNVDDLKLAVGAMVEINRSTAEAFERVIKAMSIYGPSLSGEQMATIAEVAERAAPSFNSAAIFGNLAPGDTMQAIQITKGG